MGAPIEKAKVFSCLGTARGAFRRRPDPRRQRTARLGRKTRARLLCAGASSARLLEKLGFTNEEMIAFGDNYNDITMIGYAGLGVAMGNAEEDVKKIANYVCESNDDDGVAKTLEKYVLKSNI